MGEFVATSVMAVAPSNDHYWNSRLVRYLAGSGISLYGDWLTTFALVVLLFRATGSATGPALYMLARVAPRVMGPTPGGLLVDRFGPIRLATTCLLAQAVLVALLVVAADNRAIWAVYVLVAIAQFANAASQPAYAAMPPRVSAPEHLGRTNGLYGSLLSSSILVSPAVGALVLPHTTPEVLIIADAITFVVAALLIGSLGMQPGWSSQGPQVGGARLGWRAVMGDASLRSGVAAVFGNSAVVTTLQALLVVAATEHFHHDTYVGWLYAGVGAGGVAASLLFLRANPRHIRRRDIVVLALIEVASLALFVVVPNIALAVALLFLSSVAAVTYQVLSAIAMQQRVPLHLLGRASGARRQAMYVGMLLGALAALGLVDALGWQATVLVVCVGSVVILLLATFTGPRDRQEPARGGLGFAHDPTDLLEALDPGSPIGVPETEVPATDPSGLRPALEETPPPEI